MKTGHMRSFRQAMPDDNPLFRRRQATVKQFPALCYTLSMNNKTTQIIIIVGIIAVVGGAVYGLFQLSKNKVGTNGDTTTAGAQDQTNAVLLNIESHIAGNSTFQRSFFVPNTPRIQVNVAIKSSETSITTPSGTVIHQDNTAGKNVTYSFDKENGKNIFKISKPAQGTWLIQITSTSPDSQPFSITVSAMTTEAATIITSKKVYAAGEDIQVTATATDQGKPVPGARWDIIYGPYTGVTPTNVQPLAVFDDGKNNDGAANDGVFGGSIPAAGLIGKYHIEGDVVFPSGLNLNTVIFVETPSPQLE